MSDPVSQDTPAAKRALRREMRAALAELDAAEAQRAGEGIADALARDVRFAKAGRVALFVAIAGEPATRPVFESLAARGVVRLLPRIVDEGLEFARVERWDELADGPFGIPAPPATAAATPLESRDWALVPGLAFDAAGGRLGRGRGYYDRAFAGASGPVLVGVGFARQLVARVPCDSRDRAMDAIVTEDGLVWASRES